MNPIEIQLTFNINTSNSTFTVDGNDKVYCLEEVVNALYHLRKHMNKHDSCEYCAHYNNGCKPDALWTFGDDDLADEVTKYLKKKQQL